MSKVTKNDRIAHLELQVTWLTSAVHELQGTENPESEPQLRQLDQSVFDGLDEKWRFAAVDSDGSARAYNYNQVPIGGNHEPHPDQSKKGFEAYEFIGTGYDTSNWQNSLIERESKELTGSELCRAMLARGDEYVVCLVSDTSDVYATDCRELTVLIEGFSARDGFWDSRSTDYSHAVPVNPATNEPLTASEVGF